MGNKTFCYIRLDDYEAICYYLGMVAEKTLQDLRKESGLPIAEIINKALEVNPKFPRTHAGFLGIEEHGTRDYWKIHALAHVYNVEPEVMAEIARTGTKPQK